MAERGLMLRDPRLPAFVEKEITTQIFTLNELVHGFGFALVLALYYEAYINGGDVTKAKVVKWFRGEYNTKTEARQELGINIIIHYRR